MSKDLDEFLRKAAERRKNRQQSGGNPSPATPQAAPTAQTIAQAEVVVVAEKPREASVPIETLGPRIQSNIHPSSLLTKEIDQADDRVRARIHSQFDHSVSTIDQGTTVKKKESQSSKQPGKKKAAKQSDRESGVAQDKSISSFEESRNDMTIERSASKMINPESMLELLRNPQTLRTAFIASQIFERKF
jgi:hypothetical protein